MEKNKQIEEMERIIQKCDDEAMYASIAYELYHAGYRKQKEGEWRKECLVGCEPYYLCSICGKLHYQPYRYCNDCGAKMKGGE